MALACLLLKLGAQTNAPDPRPESSTKCPSCSLKQELILEKS